MLKKLLPGPIVFTPHRDATSRHYTFSARLNVGPLLTGTACANMMASPICASWNQLDGWLRQVEGLRRAA